MFEHRLPKPQTRYENLLKYSQYRNSWQDYLQTGEGTSCILVQVHLSSACDKTERRRRRREKKIPSTSHPPTVYRHKKIRSISECRSSKRRKQPTVMSCICIILPPPPLPHQTIVYSFLVTQLFPFGHHCSKTGEKKKKNDSSHKLT